MRIKRKHSKKELHKHAIDKEAYTNNATSYTGTMGSKCTQVLIIGSTFGLLTLAYARLRVTVLGLSVCAFVCVK